MNKKEKLIIEKLVKITEGQQKTIALLLKKAQAVVQPVQDPNVLYIQRAWQVATVNSGVPQVSTPVVTVNPGRTGENVQVDATYTVNAKDIPPKNDLRQKLLNTFKTQIKTQKPELDGKVSVIFV